MPVKHFKSILISKHKQKWLYYVCQCFKGRHFTHAISGVQHPISLSHRWARWTTSSIQTS